mmetsp:Transcript_15776/g.34158  ORF Transcript_15776/g.34158 Transcript_15776/m.34158 type:complete len:302 (+) Transcript_15776:2353-3258(+)
MSRSEYMRGYANAAIVSGVAHNTRNNAAARSSTLTGGPAPEPESERNAVDLASPSTDTGSTLSASGRISWMTDDDELQNLRYTYSACTLLPTNASRARDTGTCAHSTACAARFASSESTASTSPTLNMSVSDELFVQNKLCTRIRRSPSGSVYSTAACTHGCVKNGDCAPARAELSSVGRSPSCAIITPRHESALITGAASSWPFKGRAKWPRYSVHSSPADTRTRVAASSAHTLRTLRTSSRPNMSASFHASNAPKYTARPPHARGSRISVLQSTKTFGPGATNRSTDACAAAISHPRFS